MAMMIVSGGEFTPGAEMAYALPIPVESSIKILSSLAREIIDNYAIAKAMPDLPEYKDNYLSPGEGSGSRPAQEDNKTLIAPEGNGDFVAPMIDKYSALYNTVMRSALVPQGLKEQLSKQHEDVEATVGNLPE